MLPEVMRHLRCEPGKTYVDCTLGGCGHSSAILRAISPGGVLIGIDRDQSAIENANNILKSSDSKIILFHENYSNLPEILHEMHINAVDGILADFGLSTFQLKASGRGFSFKKDEPLNMRMDMTMKTKASITAKNLVNEMSESELANIIFKYGEERYAKRIAKSIVKYRLKNSINTSGQLSKIVCYAIPNKKFNENRIHPATRTFMAIRIAVNNELEHIEKFMDKVPKCLKTGGRLCAISFHSLEDRIVKRKMRYFEKDCLCPKDFPKCICNKEKIAKCTPKKAITPTKQEIKTNPLSRSARLRVMEKI